MSGSKNTIYGLVSQFLGQQNNISVPVPLVRMLGDYTAAAFVAQVTYWSDRTRDPEGWFWKTYEQWLEEMHLTNDQIRRCVKTANGLVEVKRAGVPARNFYRINRGLLVERLQELADREIVITSRNGETQHLGEDTDFPHGQSLGNPTASAQANPTSSTKTTSKTSAKKKEGGEYNLESNARATQPQSAPVVEPGTAPVTTSFAARGTAGGQTRPAAGVAVLPPDGGAADAAVTDSDLEFLFGDQVTAMQETGTITEVQEGPGGAAGPLAAQDAQEGLSGRSDEPHDPEATRALLLPALGGQKKLNSLMEEAPPSLRGKTRRGWITEITPERAAELIIEARREAGADNPWTYIIRALDQELGAQFKKGQPGGGGVRGWNADVTGGANHPQARPTVEPEPEQPTDAASVGTKWEHKHTVGRIVTVTSVGGGYVELDNGEQILRFLLYKDYKSIGQ